MELAGLDNEEEFAGKILFLLNSDKRRKALEANCNNYARFNNADKIAERYAEFYETLMPSYKHLVEEATSHTR